MPFGSTQVKLQMLNVSLQYTHIHIQPDIKSSDRWVFTFRDEHGVSLARVTDFAWAPGQDVAAFGNYHSGLQPNVTNKAAGTLRITNTATD